MKHETPYGDSAKSFVAGHPPIRKILYATDLSDDSPKVFRYVLSLARQFDAEITSLHVVGSGSGQADLTLSDCFTRTKLMEMRKAELQQALGEMNSRDRAVSERCGDNRENRMESSRQGSWVLSENRVAYGNVAEQILQCSAQVEADLIVLGEQRKPRTLFRRKSVCSTIARRAKVPVTIVPFC